MLYDNEHIENFITYLKCEMDKDEDINIYDHWRFYTTHFLNNVNYDVYDIKIEQDVSNLNYKLLKIDYKILKKKYDFLLKSMDITRKNLREDLQKFV